MRLILIPHQDRTEHLTISDFDNLGVETFHAETVAEVQNLLADNHGKNGVDGVVVNLEASAGVEVLAYLRSHQPALPALLLSDTVETAIALDGLRLLPQDVAAERLVAEFENVSGGVSLPHLLQVVALQNCTCSVRVSAGARQGSIHFSDGELTDAYLFDQQLDGEAAALEILTWHDPKAEVREARPSQDRFITRSLLELLRQGSPAESEPAESTAEDAVENATETEPNSTETEQVEAAVTSDEATTVEADTDMTTTVETDGDMVSADVTDTNTPDQPTTPTVSLADNPALAHLLEPAAQQEQAHEQPSVTLHRVPDQAAKETSVTDLRHSLEQEAQGLHETFQHLRDRAREADEAIANVLTEFEAFRARQERYRQAEAAFNERQEQLEQVRSGAEALAQQLLSVVKQVSEKTPAEPIEAESEPEAELA